MNDAPNFLVEWSSPWQEFVTAIRPALARSPERLAGEARSGLFPYKGMLGSWLLEVALLVLVILLPAKLASMRPFVPPPLPKYDVIYFSGDELPQTEDAGGAQAGKSGRAGGREGYHRTQTIRVSRGNSLRQTVVDAPKLNLPHSDSAVANLLAYKPIPGPPPAEGMKSSRSAPTLSPTAIAPPPEVQRDKMQAAPSLASSVIAPAPAFPQREIALLHLPGSQGVAVIPPPVSAPEQDTTLNPKLLLPAPSVIAPPPTISRETPRNGSGFGVGGGAGVVPPPPTVSGGSSLTGRGSGNRGAGLGGPGDLGAVATPPSNGGGTGGGTGIVISSQPGSKVGLPGGGGAGSLAMSPSGGAEAGLGGSGGGSGIGRGNGPGSGFSGEGRGAGKEGTGRGSDPNAHGGISPYPGPGGAGCGVNGKSAIPGVSVRGGGNVITLPSFSSGGDQPEVPGRSSATDNRGPGITVVATSRSGGAFNYYGVLKGDKVYTIYIETVLGTAVMQFADPTSANHPYAEDLTAPQPLRADLPANLARSRLVIACILDRSGLLRNPKVLDPGPAEMTSKVLAALTNWKFRPVLRGDTPVEVNAILGFNIDTNDRF